MDIFSIYSEISIGHYTSLINFSRAIAMNSMSKDFEVAASKYTHTHRVVEFRRRDYREYIYSERLYGKVND